jgi:hypothetical protein
MASLIYTCMVKITGMDWSTYSSSYGAKLTQYSENVPFCPLSKYMTSRFGRKKGEEREEEKGSPHQHWSGCKSAKLSRTQQAGLDSGECCTISATVTEVSPRRGRRRERRGELESCMGHFCQYGMIDSSMIGIHQNVRKEEEKHRKISATFTPRHHPAGRTGSWRPAPRSCRRQSRPG